MRADQRNATIRNGSAEADATVYADGPEADAESLKVFGSCGASHAHRRSPAPRCAALERSAASRIRSRRAGSASNAATASSNAVASATSNAAPAAIALRVASAKLNMCGPTIVGRPDGDWLDQVLSSERHQAAAHESDVRGDVVGGELAHRIAQHDVDVRRHRRIVAAANERDSARAQQIRHDVEALWMTRHDERQRSGGQRALSRAPRRSSLPRRRASMPRQRSVVRRRIDP